MAEFIPEEPVVDEPVVVDVPTPDPKLSETPIAEIILAAAAAEQESPEAVRVAKQAIGYKRKPEWANPGTPNPHDYDVVRYGDPRRALSPGQVFLDEVLRRRAEIRRAKVEGREPDLDNPGPIVGTPLKPRPEGYGY